MKTNLFSAIISASSLVSSCKKSSEGDVSGVGIKATALSSTQFHVCWENRSQADLDFKDLRTEFGQYIEKEFDRTNLRLHGWTDCGNPNSAKNEIGITWWDEGEAAAAGRVNGSSGADNCSQQRCIQNFGIVFFAKFFAGKSQECFTA